MSRGGEGRAPLGRVGRILRFTRPLILVIVGLAGALYLVSGRNVLPGRGDAPSFRPDGPVDAGPEVAERVVERLRLVREGKDAGTVELTSSELTALLRHVLTGMIPPGVEEPYVLVVDDEVRVWARVSPELLPSGRFLTESLENLPAMADVEVRGHLAHASASDIEYRIEQVFVERVALPGRLVSVLVTASGGLASSRTVEVERADDAGSVAAAPTVPAFRARWPLERGRIAVEGGVVRIVPIEPKAAQQVDGSDGLQSP